MTEEKTTKQKWGMALIVVPLLVWFLVALVNGFSLAHYWTSSVGMDWFLGISAVLAVIVGIVLVKSKDE